MTTHLLRKQTSKLYKTFEKALCIFHQNNTKGMFDKHQYNIYGKSKQAFVGKKLCGSSCFILKYLLEDLGYDIQVFKNSRRDEFGIEDHVFLYTQGHIIDPTWRQFMVDPRSKEDSCAYRTNLFCNFEPFMIQKPQNVNNQIQNLIDINAGCYKKPFIDFDDIKKYWEFEIDDTPRYNLHKYIDNHALLNGKPDYYKEVVGYIINSRSNMQEPIEDFNSYKLERSGKLDKYMGFAHGKGGDY